MQLLADGLVVRPNRFIPAHATDGGPGDVLEKASFMPSGTRDPARIASAGLYDAGCRLVASPLTTTGPSGPAKSSRSVSKWGDVEDREPIFNVPAGVLAVLAVLIAVHVTLSLMPEDEFIWWVLALAFIPARYSGLASQLPGGEPAMFTSFVTHMAVHADLIHLAFNALWLLAFGSVLCSRIGTIRFLAFSISGGIAGALLFLALNPGLAAPVIGASGAVSAMMGGVMRFLFNAIDRGQGYLLRRIRPQFRAFLSSAL